MRNIVQAGMWLICNSESEHRFGDAEQMFQTLFLNTFGSSATVNWGILRKYHDTALSRGHSLSCGYSILSPTSQNTLIKTPV